MTILAHHPTARIDLTGADFWMDVGAWAIMIVLPILGLTIMLVLAVSLVRGFFGKRRDT